MRRTIVVRRRSPPVDRDRPRPTATGARAVDLAHVGTAGLRGKSHEALETTSVVIASDRSAHARTGTRRMDRDRRVVRDLAARAQRGQLRLGRRPSESSRPMIGQSGGPLFYGPGVALPLSNANTPFAEITVGDAQSSCARATGAAHTSAARKPTRRIRSWCMVRPVGSATEPPATSCGCGRASPRAWPPREQRAGGVRARRASCRRALSTTTERVATACPLRVMKSHALVTRSATTWI